jgi:hypothetical protein
VPYIPTNIMSGTEAREFARDYSVNHPDEYVVLVNDFGACLMTARRLWAQAPSDSYTGTYFLNGSERPFTDAQRLADQRATPVLS